MTEVRGRMNILRILTRKRLDVPEVAALLRAQARMLNNWSDTERDSEERRKLWRDLHRAGDELAERVYR